MEITILTSSDLIPLLLKSPLAGVMIGGLITFLVNIFIEGIRNDNANRREQIQVCGLLHGEKDNLGQIYCDLAITDIRSSIRKYILENYTLDKSVRANLANEFTTWNSYHDKTFMEARISKRDLFKSLSIVSHLFFVTDQINNSVNLIMNNNNNIINYVNNRVSELIDSDFEETLGALPQNGDIQLLYSVMDNFERAVFEEFDNYIKRAISDTTDVLLNELERQIIRPREELFYLDQMYYQIRMCLAHHHISFRSI